MRMPYLHVFTGNCLSSEGQPISIYIYWLCKINVVHLFTLLMALLCIWYSYNHSVAQNLLRWGHSQIGFRSSFPSMYFLITPFFQCKLSRSIGNQSGTLAAEGKTMLNLRHFSEPRPSRALKLVEASKYFLPILRIVYATLSLMFAPKQGSWFRFLAQTGFPAFGKGVQLIGGSP